MAHDNEYRLLSKVIRDRNIIPVLETGIKDEWFVDDEIRRIYKFVREHYVSYREVPTATAVVDNFPNFKVLNVEDSLDYLVDKMIEFRRFKLTRNGLDASMQKFVNDGYEKAVMEMSNTVALVNEQGEVGTSHVNLSSDPDARFHEYENRQNSVMLGVPTGFKTIDDATAGLQAGQLITIIAPPKTGKSQLALRMAVNVHESGLVPAFQSFEMSNQEQAQRHDAMRAHIPSKDFRLGKLNSIEEARYTDMLDDLKSMKPFHLIDAVNGLTIDSLMAKADQLKPDVLFVDGVYLMLDQVTGEANTPQALTNITRGLKRAAQRLEIPIVITTQTLLWKMKNGKVSADSIGYSSSFFQDSDVIIGLEPIEHDEETRNLKIVQSRNCPPVDTALVWDWNRGCFHEESERSTCKWCVPFMGSTFYGN
jgi:replicative DNA helicase